MLTVITEDRKHDLKKKKNQFKLLPLLNIQAFHKN